MPSHRCFVASLHRFNRLRLAILAAGVMKEWIARRKEREQDRCRLQAWMSYLRRGQVARRTRKPMERRTRRSSV
eukprot:COSAG01_NODE_3213_length_6410_cov_2.970211_7_plen_74_part_00